MPVWFAPCGFFYAYCTWLWSGQLRTLWFSERLHDSIQSSVAWGVAAWLVSGRHQTQQNSCDSIQSSLAWRCETWPRSGSNVLMFVFGNVLMFAFDNVLMFVIEWNWMFVLLIIWDAFGVFECSKKGLMFCESSYKVRFFWRQNEH